MHRPGRADEGKPHQRGGEVRDTRVATSIQILEEFSRSPIPREAPCPPPAGVSEGVPQVASFQQLGDGSCEPAPVVGIDQDAGLAGLDGILDAPDSVRNNGKPVRGCWTPRFTARHR